MPTTPGPRTIRLVRPKDEHGVAVFRITDPGRATTDYVAREVPCAIGGRAFAVSGLGLADVFHVRVGRRADCSCECLGFLRHGRCRHVSGLLALIREGKL